LRLIRDERGSRDEVFELAEVTVLGRTEPSQIVLAHSSVSREHASIRATSQGYVIEDMNSTNGTQLNGEKIQRAALHNGDVIRIHDFALEFVDDPKPKSRSIESGVLSASTGSATLIATRPYQDVVGSVGKGDPVSVLKRRLEVLYGVSRSAIGSFNVDSLLTIILGELFQIFGQADYGFVLMKDPKTDAFTVAASRQSDASDEEPTPSTTIIEHASQMQQAVLSVSALDDARFQGAQSIVGSATTSVICAPVVADDEVLGVIYIATRRTGRSFTEDDLQLVVCVAATLAIFLQNARLHMETVQAQRLAAIGDAVTRLAHCIKNILNGIQAGAYIVDLGIDKDDRDKVVKGWEITKRNNAFLSNLVLDMLSYGKQRAPRYESTDINDLVQTIVDLNTEKAKGQGTTIGCELDPTLSQVPVDPVAIYRCVLNLVSNAVDACAGKEGAAVCARTIAPDASGYFTIRIEDTGCGMSEEIRSSLFQDFFSTKGAKGTGLGLPVVKKTVEEHGGEVEVTSEEGVGSAFTIRLPMEAVVQADSNSAEG